MQLSQSWFRTYVMRHRTHHQTYGCWQSLAETSKVRDRIRYEAIDSEDADAKGIRDQEAGKRTRNEILIDDFHFIIKNECWATITRSTWCDWSLHIVHDRETIINSSITDQHYTLKQQNDWLAAPAWDLPGIVGMECQTGRLSQTTNQCWSNRGRWRPASCQQCHVGQVDIQ